MSRRPLRVLATLLVTGLAVGYILWQIDVGRAAHDVAHARLLPLLGSVAIMVGTVPVFAWRWRVLLRARGIAEPLSWLTRAYFVAYTAGQVLPTSLGGDAARIYETTRRHTGTVCRRVI